MNPGTSPINLIDKIYSNEERDKMKLKIEEHHMESDPISSFYSYTDNVIKYND